MSSGDKSKSSSQTDGKAAQGKKSEMGMMSYKVSVFSNGRQTKTICCQTLTPCVYLPRPDVRVRPGELPGSHDRDQQRVHERV